MMDALTLALAVTILKFSERDYSGIEIKNNYSNRGVSLVMHKYNLKKIHAVAESNYHEKFLSASFQP